MARHTGTNPYGHTFSWDPQYGKTVLTGPPCNQCPDNPTRSCPYDSGLKQGQCGPYNVQLRLDFPKETPAPSPTTRSQAIRSTSGVNSASSSAGSMVVGVLVVMAVIWLVTDRSEESSQNESEVTTSVVSTDEQEQMNDSKFPSYKAALRGGNKLVDAKRYSEAVLAFRTALEYKPNDSRALSEISWAAFLAGDMTAAREAAERSIRSTDNANLKAASLYNLGRVEEHEGNLAAAKRAYQDSLKLRSNKIVRNRLRSLSN